MIRKPSRRFNVMTSTINNAALLVDRSQAATLIEQWAIEDGKQPSRAPYSPRSLLIGIYLLILTSQPLTWAALLQLFWFQMSRQQLALLGLEQTVTEQRQRELLPYVDDDELVLPPRLQAAYTSEYQRLAKSLDVMFGTMRWSPHSRKRREKNKDLKAVLAAQTSVEAERSQRALDRQNLLINRIIAASVDRDLLKPHLGDIMFDEVVIQTAKAQGNTGVRDTKRHSGNPDAGWWSKGNTESPRWAHGATFVMATHRPGEARIPTVVIGMGFGKPTGGNLADTLVAIDQASGNGFLPRSGHSKHARYAIADLGFTYKDGLNEALVDRGYYLVQDYQKNVNRRTVLDSGAVLFNGVFICPGFEPETRIEFNPLPDGATNAATIRHQKRESALLAGRMSPNGRPKKATREGRGRPKKNEKPAAGMRVEVSCPAAALQCRCPIVADSMKKLSEKEYLTVQRPPNLTDLPAVCSQTFTSIFLKGEEFKQYGLHLFGSDRHKRLYKYVRACNEQWHSQFRASQTGGIDETFFSTRGVERIALITALAVAETNLAMQRAYRTKHLGPGGTPKIAPGAAA